MTRDKFWWSISIVVGFVLLEYGNADAHHAKAGWAYDAICCSNRDCKQLHKSEVKITPQGYKWDGEIFPFQGSKIKPSQDQHYHGCKIGSQYRPCLYVPFGGV